MRLRTTITLSALALSAHISPARELRTGDGLVLGLTDNGTVQSLASGASSFPATGRPPGLFRVRDYPDGEWTELEAELDGPRFRGEAPALGLGVEAELRVYDDRIEIKGALIDRRGEERSAQLMCLLPAAAPGRRWHLDIEEHADPDAARPAIQATASTDGAYCLWIDAFDFDPQMGYVSVVEPGGKERILALLSPEGTPPADVDQTWRTFVVPGIRESDLVDGALNLRIGNFPGAYTLVDIGSVFLMNAAEARGGDDRASQSVAGSVQAVRERSLASWVATPNYRERRSEAKGPGDFTALGIPDGCWIELPLQVGQRHEGEPGNAVLGQLPPWPDADGKLRGLGYPWATLTQRDAGGYSLSVSPDIPCEYRFDLDTRVGELQLILSYGLSTHPKAPELESRAPFHIVLFRTDDAWAFREAAQRYYRLSPALFERPTERFGFWYGSGPDRDYHGLDGEFAYLEVHEARLYPRHFLENRAAWAGWKQNLRPFFPRCSDLGILVLPYRHFYHCSLHVKGDMDGTLPHMPTTYAEAMAMVEALRLPFGNGYAHHIGDVIETSCMRRKDGTLDLKLSADDACAPTGRLVYRTSISPYLYDDRPETMTNARSEMEFARELLDEFPDVGGIYYDAGAGGGGVTYSPEHLRYARSPLVPGPGMGRMAGKYEFGRWMGEFLHARGKVHFVNGGHGMGCWQTWHVLPFDCIGIEWPPVLGGEREFRFLRTLAGHKPVSFLIARLSGDAKAQYLSYISRLALYGIFPPPSTRLTAPATAAPDPTLLVASYAKILQELYAAGWEPVTHTRRTPAGLRVERFGPDGGRVFFAVRNPGHNAVRAEVVIDTDALGFGQLERAVLHLGNTKQVTLAPGAKGTARATFDVPAQGLVVLETGTGELSDPDAVADFYPAKHRAWRAELAKPRLIADWSFDEGKGQTTTNANVDGPAAVLGRSDALDAQDPAWTAEGRTGSALRFDGVDDVVSVNAPGGLRILNAFTVEAWIKQERRTTHARVVDFGGTCVYFEGDADRVGLRIGGYSVNTAWSTPIPLDHWTHLRCTYDGKVIRVFVDGKLCGTKDYLQDSPLQMSGMAIGNGTTIPRPFAGLVDDVKLWNYVE